MFHIVQYDTNVDVTLRPVTDVWHSGPRLGAKSFAALCSLS